MPALRLSYHHLPLELRQCFAYFAAFPKDYEIRKEELILLWVAHGFISSKGTESQVEDVGNEICNELLLRSLLQSNKYDGDKFSMHDLVHDLAQSVMENKVPGIQSERNMASASSSTIRQVNLFQKIVMFPKTFQQDMSIASIMEFTSLRVLNASGHGLGIRDLPPSISSLKHLRFLNLSDSPIITLPNSLCSLWNLQILNLDQCYSLVALPKNTRYLRNLQHLCLSYCKSLSEMPLRMRELSSLKTLSMFVVGSNKGSRLEELECLNLSGSLELRHLERVKDHLDAKKAHLAHKKGLRVLGLSWERNSPSRLGEDVDDEKVLEALKPHPNLEELSINGFSGRIFPLWMSNSTLGKIVEIQIIDCQNCRRLSKLGELPHLKRLLLSNVGVEYIIEEDEVGRGSGNPIEIQFVALEELELSSLPNLKGLFKKQESKEAFPNLKYLKIEGCSLLTLPPVSYLEKLEDLHCSSSTLDLFPKLDSLTRLHVTIEETTTCFPIETLVRFNNLRNLMIVGAKEISVLEEGLQTLKENLISLHIFNCNIPEGLLRHLTALWFLYISSCPELVELPEEIKHLHNLTTLFLHNLPKMACLPEALRHLSSLRCLYLNSLPELESLLEWLNQLTSLTVKSCPKLLSLPLTILNNLKALSVEKCQELEMRCKRVSGDY